MGTINLHQTIGYENISDIMQYSSYTVKRTSGEIESDWRAGYSLMFLMPHRAYFHTITQKWHIFLHNGKYDSDCLGGYRPLDTIHPTILTGDQIDVWRKTVELQLQALDEERLKRGTG
jgi:hypothetical protein